MTTRAVTIMHRMSPLANTRLGCASGAPFDAFAQPRGVPRGAFQVDESVVDEIVADVLLANRRGVRRLKRQGAVPNRVPPRHLDGAAGDRDLGVHRSLGDPLDDMSVRVAGGEGHQRVEPGRILAQHRLHRALMLDELPPVTPSDVPQARDAVGHHDLRERQVIRAPGPRRPRG